MSKNLSAAALTKIQTKVGTEPIIIVSIDWGRGFHHYADKDFNIAKGKIISISGLNTIRKVTSGFVGSLQLVLDDTDEDIKSIVNSSDPHKSKVVVYQSFEGLSWDEKFEIFRGEINTPFIFSEANYTYEFDVVSIVEALEVGYSIEEDDHAYINEESVGQAAPLVFGDCLNVRTLKLTDRVEGQSGTKGTIVSEGDLSRIFDQAKSYGEALFNATIIMRRVNEGTGILRALSQPFFEPPSDFIQLLQEGRTNLDSTITISISDDETDFYDYLLELRSSYLEFLNIKQEIIHFEPEKEDFINEYFQQSALIAYNNLEIPHLFDVLTDLQSDLDAAYIEAFNSWSFLISFIYAVVGRGNARIGNDGIDELLNSRPERQFVDWTPYTQLIGSNNALKSSLNSVGKKITKFTLTELIISGGENFPQGQNIRINVNGAVLEGTMDYETFTTSGELLPELGKINLKARDISDNLVDNPDVAWIEDVEVPLANKYCLLKLGAKTRYNPTPPYVPVGGAVSLVNQNIQVTNQLDDGGILGGEFYVIRINRHEENRITFSNALLRNNVVVDENTSPQELFEMLSNENAQIIEVASFILPSWLSRIRGQDFNELPPAVWKVDYGDAIVLEVDYDDIFIANIAPNSTIKEVNTYSVDIDGRRKLMPLPDYFYEVKPTYDLEGLSVTALVFDKSLLAYLGEYWDEQIYVTIDSSLSHNVSDIIKYIVESYTNFSVDASSFATVKTQVENYPANFVLHERVDAIQLIEDIAWQARCAVWINNDIIYIKYLSTTDTTVANINQTNIKTDSLVVEFTETEDLVTKFIAEWRPHELQERAHEIIFRNNIPKYGLIEKRYQFWIYNIEELVVKSSMFWQIRYSNTWKKLRCKVFLDFLNRDLFDYLNINFDTTLIANNDATVTGIIDSINYDPSAYNIDLEIWTDIRSGEMYQFPWAFPSSVDPEFIYHSDLNPFVGGLVSRSSTHPNAPDFGPVFPEPPPPKDLSSQLETYLGVGRRPIKTVSYRGLDGKVIRLVGNDGTSTYASKSTRDSADTKPASPTRNRSIERKTTTTLGSQVTKLAGMKVQNVQFCQGDRKVTKKILLA